MRRRMAELDCVRVWRRASMLGENTATYAGKVPHRWANAESEGGVGPQGAALILELQRLKQALDRDQVQAPSGRRPSPGRRNPGPPKPLQKRNIKQTIAGWLEQFGLASPGKQKHSKTPRRRAAVTPLHSRREPDISSDAPPPTVLDQAPLQPHDTHQSMHIENIRMELPSPTSVADSSPSANRLVAICRNG